MGNPHQLTWLMLSPGDSPPWLTGSAVAIPRLTGSAVGNATAPTDACPSSVPVITAPTDAPQYYSCRVQYGVRLYPNTPHTRTSCYCECATRIMLHCSWWPPLGHTHTAVPDLISPPAAPALGTALKKLPAVPDGQRGLATGADERVPLVWRVRQASQSASHDDHRRAQWARCRRVSPPLAMGHEVDFAREHPGARRDVPGAALGGVCGCAGRAAHLIPGCDNWSATSHWRRRYDAVLRAGRHR